MKITATRAEGEFWRIERLAKVKAMLAILEADIPRIVSLDDHKGDLTVVWEEDPGLEEDLGSHGRFIIQTLWSLMGEPNVIHEIHEEDEDERRSRLKDEATRTALRELKQTV